MSSDGLGESLTGRRVSARSYSQLSNVISYIQNQEKHHARSSFREEYLLFLKKFDVKFDSKYVFEFIEEIA